ncbi:ABC transporter substrate-binding protein [Oribacterium sp. WCC10]|uniref:ABC transporter substrate-binding protein n=1 Tax=Oribacterium sp. WCC10 TaxID=1855343 RepID=UPI0008E79253|nr:ABC transporter substrate-binding protein [Oribacterium sp. WCC10]SFG14361.1 carbohydrate ABC transporter substrate-binding protein, CUT1 family [Oribacterium sp. WCC10]
MKKSINRLAALLMTAACVSSLVACGGSTKTETATTAAAAEGTTAAAESKEAVAPTEKSDLAGQSITILNSKGEIQTALEELAATFTEETGIELEVLSCGTGEVPYTKVTSMYSSGTAPTMSILDTTDVIALATEYGLDLSDQDWIQYCDSMTTKVDGKVYSFPFCVEGRGIIYSKKAIEDALGKEFDPASINSLDSFKAICEELRAAGMENPVVLSKEDWSLGAHQLGYIYDTNDGTTAGADKIMAALKDGSQKVEDYDRFNQFMDTMDVILEYNYNKEDPLGAIYDEDAMHLVDGDAAFWPNGNWAWPNIETAGATTDDEFGFISFVLGNDTADFANTSMQASPTKQLMVDAKQSTPEQQAAALEFINWLVNSESGQKGLVEKLQIIPACSNNTVAPLDPLSRDIVAKMADGHTYSSSFVAPSDHWSVVGAIMQKYVAGETDRAGAASEIDAYWQKQA